MADRPGGARSATERELLSVMSQILASGLSHHDTEELLGEALGTDGIYPAVAATAGSLGGPPVLSVPGLGHGRGQGEGPQADAAGHLPLRHG